MDDTSTDFTKYGPSTYWYQASIGYSSHMWWTYEYATVNQNAYYDAWMSLGTFYFTANGSEYVELSDAIGEAASTKRQLGFDAVKFAK